ncbi:TVP38/TMEM64 family protein [Streptomyces meridianus]|uniref:TVP38/TMEM64 family membrane protein n=1 Tax=Streptomyces meridianus TaxID=2938945 RepID=A0ABT0X4C8_9ACTN|nr:TVP38/TMEM64 family protein [Streptomyces meridianus]MCM2577404.1 TVP38/TMEM64 family protein [Streptomyces meridianus]
MLEATTQPPGPAARCSGALFSPWSRLALLVVLLACAATGLVVYEPQHLLADGWPPRFSGLPAAGVFAVGYGLCTAALVPRTLLNLGAGALFGPMLGLGAALGGTVVGAAIAFALGRGLGQAALRPLLRGRWLLAADRQLSRHGFRSMIAVRLAPGLPFALANYCAAVSRVRWTPFLIATALGSVPNTAAYVVAGSEASSPTSPAFLLSAGFIALTGIAAAFLAWRARGRAAARTPDPAVEDPLPTPVPSRHSI